MATASEDAGFDPGRVLSLELWLSGSGGVDNLAGQLISLAEPGPGVLVWLSVTGLLLLRRRR